MSKLKKEILNKLKEYANKMGRDHLGGDDYTSKRRGGLRDFDGYDNVDYNKDMPMDEGMFSTIDQIRQDSKNVRDFVKKVFADRDFKDMKNDKEFLKYLKSIYEGTNESKGVPANYMQGRVSDYHTALRGKNRDYSGGTNFKKKHHGQPDIENEDEDQETNHLKSESGKKKSEKNYKDWKSTNEGFDKVEHLSLLNKALRAMPGSPKQKDIIRKLNKVRKAGGMRPLKEQGIVEYGQRLDLSFLEDEEARLKGTPPSKDAIDRDIDESLKDMVGDTYTFSIGSGDEKWIKPNTKEYVIEKIAETIKHNLYDWDFSLNGIDGSQAKEYSKIFDNDVLKPLLRNIDKTLKTYFKIDSKNKKISWKLSSRDNDKIIDAFFKKNKKISSDIRDSYFSQNEVAKRDLDESTINEIGLFPIRNYLKGIIPKGRLDVTDRKSKERVKALVGDLKSTLNHFWKQHKIPYRIK